MKKLVNNISFDYHKIRERKVQNGVLGKRKRPLDRTEVLEAVRVC